LIGTLVHSNPEKSIAAIEVRSKNQVVSYSIKKEIEGLATVEKIERMKVFIRNLNTNRLEYIEIKKEGGLTFGAAAPASPALDNSSDIKQVAKNEFAIKRSDLEKYLKNMTSILMDARMIPSRDPATGQTNGFRFVDIKPGSIFNKIGFQVNDTLKMVNGQPVDSLEKAMQLFQALKTADAINIQVDRGGRGETLKYKIGNN
jgi:general secretion pathway protein C